MPNQFVKFMCYRDSWEPTDQPFTEVLFKTKLSRRKVFRVTHFKARIIETFHNLHERPAVQYLVSQFIISLKKNS